MSGLRLASPMIAASGLARTEGLLAFTPIIEALNFMAPGSIKASAAMTLSVVAASTITNYAGSITKTSLEAPSQAHALAVEAIYVHSLFRSVSWGGRFAKSLGHVSVDA